MEEKKEREEKKKEKKWTTDYLQNFISLLGQVTNPQSNMQVLLCQYHSYHIVTVSYWHLIGKLTQLLSDRVVLVEFKPISASCVSSDTDTTHEQQRNFSVSPQGFVPSLLDIFHFGF